MKAKRIYIITVGFDTSGELLKGAEALYDRVLTTKRAQVVALLSLKHLGAVKFGEPTYKFGVADPEGLAAETDVGVYVMGHHGLGTPGVGNLTPEQLSAGLVAAGFKSIRKLCLVACKIAVDGEDVKKQLGIEEKQRRTVTYQTDKQVGFAAAQNEQAAAHAGKLASDAKANANNAQMAVQRAFLGNLAMHLAAAGMRPMIAGWDSFITVCYADHAVVKKAPLANQQAQVDLPEARGRKIFAPNTNKQSTYGFARPGDGETALKGPSKVIIQWQGDGADAKVMAVGPEGWSDKNRLALQ